MDLCVSWQYSQYRHLNSAVNIQSTELQHVAEFTSLTYRILGISRRQVILKPDSD